MESSECGVSVEVVRVKEEPYWQQSTEDEAPDMSYTEFEETPEFIKKESLSEESVEIDADYEIEDQIKPEPDDFEQSDVPIKATPVLIKNESSSEENEIYADCEIKHRIKIEPEEFNQSYEPSIATPVLIKRESSSEEGEIYAGCEIKHRIKIEPEEFNQSYDPNISNQTTNPVTARDSGEKPYTCDICNKTLSCVRNLNEHKKIVHEGKTPRYIKPTNPVYCDICNKMLSCVRNLNEHKRKIHKNLYLLEKTKQHGAWHCDICVKDFSSSRNVDQHKRRFHEWKIPSHINKTKPFYCDICKKQFAELLQFTVHLQKHATGLSYQTCDKHSDYTAMLNHRDLIHACNKRISNKIELVTNKKQCRDCDHVTTNVAHKRFNILRR